MTIASSGAAGGAIVALVLLLGLLRLAELRDAARPVRGRHRRRREVSSGRP